MDCVFLLAVGKKLASATIRLSLGCTGPQQYNSASPMFIRYVIREIEVFFLLPSTKTSESSSLNLMLKV